MYWWIATVGCICGALLIQYLCSSKLLHMKQQISIKSISLRDARGEEGRLMEQETELKNQHSSLEHSIDRLRTDIKRLRAQIKEKEMPVPDPDFPMEELEDEEEDESA